MEVTKLSLLLKVLEDETDETLNRQRKLFHERALPNLGGNIKCGNSLIGPDFYEGKQMNLLDTEEAQRVNVFDWQAEFPEIFKADGFDAVIGNPPYVFGRDWKALGISDNVKNYLGATYKSSPYQLDMFSIFMEKVSLLCRYNGFVGQIVPNVWLTNSFSAKTRSYILKHAHELNILATPKNVFSGITVDTVVYFYKKSKDMDECFYVRVMDANHRVGEISKFCSATYLDGTQPISTTNNSVNDALLTKIRQGKGFLQSFADITRGVHPYRIGGYGKSAFVDSTQIQKDVDERPYHSKIPLKGYRNFIYGKDLKRYSPPEGNEYIKYGKWLAEPRKPEFFEGCRIYSRKILGDRLLVTIEEKNSIADQQVYITLPKPQSYSAKYLVALLGSSLMAFFIRNYYDECNDAFPQIKVEQLKNLPIYLLDLSATDDKAKHDQMVQLVEQMLALHKQLADAKTGHEQTLIQRQIDVTDQQIDKLVYELYELTEEEIKIVEGQG